MSPGTNMIVITFLCTMVGFKTDIYYRYPVVFILYYGILTAKITNKLIVATMTKSELRLTDPSLWSLVVLLLNQYYRVVQYTGSITSITTSGTTLSTTPVRYHYQNHFKLYDR